MITLPLAYGGFGIRTRTDEQAAAAYWATWRAARAPVRALAEGLGLPLSHDPDAGDAEHAADILAKAGLLVTEHSVSLTSDATIRYSRTPWRADQASEDLLRLRSDSCPGYAFTSDETTSMG